MLAYREDVPYDQCEEERLRPNCASALSYQSISFSRMQFLKVANLISEKQKSMTGLRRCTDWFG